MFEPKATQEEFYKLERDISELNRSAYAKMYELRDEQERKIRLLMDHLNLKFEDSTVRIVKK